jgi:hypothetical protein
MQQWRHTVLQRTICNCGVDNNDVMWSMTRATVESSFLRPACLFGLILQAALGDPAGGKVLLQLVDGTLHSQSTLACVRTRADCTVIVAMGPCILFFFAADFCTECRHMVRGPYL